MKISIIYQLAMVTLVALSLTATGQVGIDNPTPNVNSSLDLGATDKGILLNRMTTLQRTTVLGPGLAASEKGLIVFDTDESQLYYWDGFGWKTVASGALSGTGLEGEVTLWDASNGLKSDTSLFWDDVYNRLGIGTKSPTAGLSIHDNSDIAFDIKNSGNTWISEHMVGIERINLPVAGSDLLNLKAPIGSPSTFQFLECEYGNTKVLKINGDGHINANSIGFGSDDTPARINVNDGTWDMKLNIVSSANPSVLPHMINFEKTVVPYAGTTLLRLKQPNGSPESAYFLQVADDTFDKLVIEGDGDLVAKNGADLIAQGGFVDVNTGAGNNRIRLAQANTGAYANFYNPSNIRTIYARSGTEAATAGGIISLYTSSEVETIILRGNDGGGGALSIRDDAGTSKITLDSDYASTGDSRIIVDELQLVGGSDFAEMFDISEDPFTEQTVLPGMVVSINPDMPGKLKVSSEPYDKKVAGIISGAGGVKPGLMMGDERTAASGDYPVALSGRVYVKASLENGEIVPGDFLTSSSTPGHAMRVKDIGKASGSILGKAMTSVNEQGLVLVLVNLQ